MSHGRMFAGRFYCLVCKGEHNFYQHRNDNAMLTRLIWCENCHYVVFQWRARGEKWR